MNTMTYQQAAAELGMSESWLRKQVAAELVPYTRLGRAVRFTPEQIATILASNAVEPAPRRRRLALASTTTPGPSWPPPSPPTPTGPVNPPHESRTRKPSRAVA